MDYYSESRMKRALGQPMYLISAEYKLTNMWCFEVQGFSGSNYKITLNPTEMKCNCFDFKLRHKLCKHLYFIIARVAKDTDSLVKLNENTNIFIINPNLTSMLKTRLKKCDTNECTNDTDDCVICFESMKNKKIIESCSICKNSFHIHCLKRWLKTKHTCPLCRTVIKLDKDQLNTDSLLYFDNLVIN